MKTKFKIGQKCKCLHPYAYRGEEPFKIIDIYPHFIGPDGKPRAVYIVEYADGKHDQIPVKNKGGYEMVCLVPENINEV